jgi:electron transfer flavoprotein alpha subunit
MLGATPLGSELAPRVAARCGLPCITEANQIKGKNKNLKITKSAYNDQLYATIKPGSKRPVVITIPPGETDILKSGETKELEVVRKDLKLGPDVKQSQFRQFIKGDPKTISIAEADIIVAVGNGVDKESFPVVQELADSLGASIGGSRVAVDKNVIPYERQIGITGKTVMPKLLVACGISGAYEFTDGMRDSDIVIAINTDEKAGIFKVANLGVKGDLNEVIPLVTDQIVKHLQDKGKDKEL